jgi:N6-adenosine-specific RNA methylase IME4
MWATNRHLPSALTIVQAWGFRYTQLLTWHKTGNPSPFGGSIAPNHAEFLVVAVRGNVSVLRRLPSSVISVAAQRRHSQKPEHFLDLIEQVSPGPYVELFARRHRLGWDVWGDQSANTATFVCQT